MRIDGFKAGIEPNDVIVAVNGTNIIDRLDYELAVFQARRNQTATLSIWRAPTGITPVELALWQATSRDRRKRQILTEEGRREFVTISIH